MYGGEPALGWQAMVAQNTMPERLGPYRLFERIGEGGMGVVHLARDSGGRAVAVKVLRPGVAGEADARRRLSREFETMRRVHSPYVAEVLDADVTGDMPYVVTRYVAGPSLDQLVREGGPLRGIALERLAWGLAEGLAAVHAAGVVHRDLKPGNVVMAGGSPVLIDFGIAHAPDVSRITQTGMFLGTPGYLAPEVVEGQPSGPSADVHSWGSTVAYAATGRAPFGTGSYETIFYRIIRGTPDLTGVPAKLMPLVTAALDRDPTRRPTAVLLSERAAALDLTAPDTPADLAAAAAAALRPAPPPVESGPSGSGGTAAFGPGTSVDQMTAMPGTVIPGTADPGLRHWHGRPVTAPRQDNFADLLPPVNYPAAGQGPARPAAPAAQGPAAQGPAAQGPAVPGQLAPYGQTALPGQLAARRPGQGPAARPTPAPPPTGLRRLLSLAVMVIAVAMSVLLPIAGTAVALVVIIALRAADLSHRGLTRRRNERGNRASDVPVMLIATPWSIVRALLGCLLLAPPALTCGCIAAAVTVIATHASPLPAAGAYGAGAIVAFYGFGPGSGTPRRQLDRLAGALTRRTFSAVLTTFVLATLTAAAIATAATQPHHIWPLTSTLSQHLHSWYSIITRVQSWLQR